MKYDPQSFSRCGSLRRQIVYSSGTGEGTSTTKNQQRVCWGPQRLCYTVNKSYIQPAREKSAGQFINSREPTSACLTHL
jgi:hypothetical protein